MCVYIYNDVCSLSSRIVLSERRQLLNNVFSEVQTHTQYDTHKVLANEKMFLEHMDKQVYMCVSTSMCMQCAVSLAAPPRTARQCFCSCDQLSSSSSSPDSHFRCFPASALLLYFLLSTPSSSSPPSIFPLLFF